MRGRLRARRSAATTLSSKAARLAGTMCASGNGAVIGGDASREERAADAGGSVNGSSLSITPVTIGIATAARLSGKRSRAPEELVLEKSLITVQ